MSNGMKDGVGSLDDIGGSQLLGRGLNRLDWAKDSKECLKVGDTEAGKHPVSYKGTDYNVGKHVIMTPVTMETYFTETFSSKDEYEKHTQSSIEVSGRYGAFSGGFETTFSTSIKRLEEREAAIYSQTVHLWKLAFEVSPANSTEEFQKRVKKLPKSFDPANPKLFFDLFVDFGPDIVNEVVVGGSLNYAMTALKTYTSQSNSLDAMVKAEYGAFISAKATTSVSQEITKHLAHRTVTLRAEGGNHSIDFSGGTPSNAHEDFKAWRESLAHAPKVVGVKLTPVYRFVEDGEARTALEDAYQWYTSHKVEVDANWKESVIVIGRSSLSAMDRTTAKGPALRIVFVDSNSKDTSEHFYYPPSEGASQEDFEQFWNLLAQQLKKKTGVKLLMATERWPRDKKYYPNASMREALRQHGASERILQRWENLTEKSQPNPHCGLTYVLAGNELDEGVDGLVVGFGQSGGGLSPRVRIEARLAHDSFGRVKVVKAGKTIEDPKTVLYIVRSNTGEKLALAMDAKQEDRVEMQKPDGSNPGQLWYMPELEKPYPEINHPTLLINYQTGTCLQGMHDEGDCRLKRMDLGRQQDDVIWDRRNDLVFHLLLVHYHGNHRNLTRIGERVSVRRWGTTEDLNWFREQHVPFI
ncbi:hypothetical protein YA0002_08725 [Pseudomonas cichorii]|uniref:MAC/perforin domain-containing protein n=1 Tax=Pseudomonas cichorii TaxID=36746 RepID=UPI0018E66352|nr:MAC/perforin domain-containing protein [Pseudomonas cichorii]MBI6852847.1 hypothetical protein [Pseudomonas cichorii]